MSKYKQPTLESLQLRAAERAKKLRTPKGATQAKIRKARHGRRPNPNRRLQSVNNGDEVETEILKTLQLLDTWNEIDAERSKEDDGYVSEADALDEFGDGDPDEKELDEIIDALSDWEIPEGLFNAVLDDLEAVDPTFVDGMLINFALSSNDEGQRSIDTTPFPFDLDLEQWQVERGRAK